MCSLVLSSPTTAADSCHPGHVLRVSVFLVFCYFYPFASYSCFFETNNPYPS